MENTCYAMHGLQSEQQCVFFFLLTIRYDDDDLTCA